MVIDWVRSRSLTYCRVDSLTNLLPATTNYPRNRCSILAISATHLLQIFFNIDEALSGASIVQLYRPSSFTNPAVTVRWCCVRRDPLESGFQLIAIRPAVSAAPPVETVFSEPNAGGNVCANRHSTQPDHLKDITLLIEAVFTSGASMGRTLGVRARLVVRVFAPYVLHRSVRRIFCFSRAATVRTEPYFTFQAENEHLHLKRLQSTDFRSGSNALSLTREVMWRDLLWLDSSSELAPYHSKRLTLRKYISMRLWRRKPLWLNTLGLMLASKSDIPSMTRNLSVLSSARIAILELIIFFSCRYIARLRVADTTITDCNIVRRRTRIKVVLIGSPGDIPEYVPTSKMPIWHVE